MNQDQIRSEKDANTCMALGAGVGALAVAGAALTGAVCPLCYFVAPGLIGLGAFRRWRSNRACTKSEIQENPKTKE